VTYRWVDHTAEIELEIRAESEREVLEDALRALAELLGIQGPGEELRSVLAQAPDRPALLAAWIEELAFLAESEGFVATRVVDVELGESRVRATVAGVLDEPPPLIKAVTYHRLAFEPSGAGYVARVVLDV
jgi:SHS2 domain-containing protein